MVAESAKKKREGEDSGGEDIFDVFVMNVLNRDDDAYNSDVNSDDDEASAGGPSRNGTRRVVDADQVGLKQLQAEVPLKEKSPGPKAPGPKP